MEREQQLTQLRAFDEEVQSHPENAQSYATKGFLESITQLVAYGLEQQDDGTDQYKEELKIIKDSIRAFSTILPTLYRTVCQNEAETRLWELTRSLMTLVETKLVQHANTGVCITAIKCLQVIVLLLSKSSQLRPDHRLLNAQELEKEATDVFNTIIGFLASDTESVLTATISCLTVIAKKRPQHVKPVVSAFTAWKKSRSSKDDSPVMMRNVEKALKLAFITMIKTEALSSQRTDLISAFGSIGGNMAMFQRHQRAEESRRQKRAAQQQQHDAEREKRARTFAEYVLPPPSPNMLVNYDITQIPLHGIVNLCMQVLQAVPIEVMSERVALLPAEGVRLAVTRPGFVRSTTPPYPPPSHQPQYNTNPRFKTEEQKIKDEQETAKQVKLENKADSDEEMDEAVLRPFAVTAATQEHMQEDKPKVEVLASVEERASQALRMQPYALANETHLSDSDKKTMLKMSVQRILQAEKMFQSNTVFNDTPRKAITNDAAPNAVPTSTSTVPATTTTATSSSTSTLSSSSQSQNIWLLLVAKLITRGTNMHYMPSEFKREQDTDMTEASEEQDDKKMIIMEDTEVDLRELLLDFIIEEFGSRHDLALEWLHEEYLLDKRNQRLDAGYIPNYFYWFHKLLERAIPTLDAKDRILTKVLLEAPELDDKTIDLIKQNLDSVPERFVPCVSTLRSLITNRPTVRFMALQVLLDLCTNKDDKMRRTSIVAVKKWNDNQADINRRVEAFSIEALHVLTGEKSPAAAGEEAPDREEEEKATAWTEKDVVRHAELYFVFCTKRPSLLKECVYIKMLAFWDEHDIILISDFRLFSVYIQASEPVQSYIQSQMVNMVRAIGMRSQDLLQLVREFPSGGETLVIAILSILCESKPPTREIIAALQHITPLAQERSIDLSSLAPLLAGQSLSSAAAAAEAAAHDESAAISTTQ
ncbi:hypothetical protein MAM1_0370c10107 [Mucor ambiguus]|uniref:Symplekin/Pta1 N-terminal domain-containing protein n=1 Tax=Mucor ambiguus TaxID=91626 RepID=A0A0C9MSZ9_9FUNG|nr:hypothetical protein MAM1_0370c10107 [Mucor ambiguus]